MHYAQDRAHLEDARHLFVRLVLKPIDKPLEDYVLHSLLVVP